jgi:hypothetical protein
MKPVTNFESSVAKRYPLKWRGGKTKQICAQTIVGAFSSTTNLCCESCLGVEFKRVQPGWDAQEVASGKAALDLTVSRYFDWIFVDQHMMASMELELRGTENVAALGSQSCYSRICGLSANDAETAFLNAGADFFIFKLFQLAKNGLLEYFVLSCLENDVVEADDDRF